MCCVYVFVSVMHKLAYMCVWVYMPARVFLHILTVFTLDSAAGGPALWVALVVWVLCVTFPGEGQCKQKYLHKEDQHKFSTVLSAMITSSYSLPNRSLFTAQENLFAFLPIFQTEGLTWDSHSPITFPVSSVLSTINCWKAVQALCIHEVK